CPHWNSGRNSAPSLVSVGRNSVPSLVSVGGIIIGISGRNSAPHWYHCAPSLVSVGGVPYHSVPSLVYSGRGIVPHQLGISISGRNSAPSLVSVGGIVPHHWYQWEE
ncbi:unnamed protein product, partial [Staurois parvus]